MEKLAKINDEIYLLMQDIVQLVPRNINSKSCNKKDFLLVKISIKELIFEPSREQIVKAFSELQYLYSDWVEDDKTTELIHFISNCKFSEDYLQFFIKPLILSQLKNVDFLLGPYINKYST